MKNDLGYFETSGDFRTLRFYYKNWRGEYGYRNTKGVPHIWYGNDEYHKEPQWFMTAYDVDKDAIRNFAMADIIEFVKEESK